MRRFSLLLLLFASYLATLFAPLVLHAQDYPPIPVSVTWNAPTTFEDGTTPIDPATDIAGYLLCYGESPIPVDIDGCNGFSREEIPDGQLTSYLFFYQPTDTLVRVYFRLRAVGSTGVEGALSNQIERVFFASRPAEPGDAVPGAATSLRFN